MEILCRTPTVSVWPQSRLYFSVCYYTCTCTCTFNLGTALSCFRCDFLSMSVFNVVNSSCLSILLSLISFFCMFVSVRVVSECGMCWSATFDALCVLVLTSCGHLKARASRSLKLIIQWRWRHQDAETRPRKMLLCDIGALTGVLTGCYLRSTVSCSELVL